MRITPIVLAILAAGTVPAAASGGLGCEAEDANVAFTVESGVSRGMGGAFFNFRGALTVAVPGVPEDLRRIDLGNALTHSWLDGEAVKLQFYTERMEGDFASLDLLVETDSVDDGMYRGRYVLVVYGADTPDPDSDRVSVTGAVECFVE